MFKSNESPKFKYAPILSLSPAEMTALEELPDKDKDLLLPVIPIKGWVGSKKLESSIPRIEKSFGKRPWIADIDFSFLEENKEKRVTGKYPRDVFYEIENLLDPKDGYANWYQFLASPSYANIIPTIQLNSLTEIQKQISQLSSLKRGIAVRFNIEHISSNLHSEVLKQISALNVEDLFVIFDYGQVGRDVLTLAAAISTNILKSQALVPSALFSISCSSFPSSFSGENIGENPIYERQLFNLVSKACPGVRMLYSDRASARADKIGGGGGIPSPRIDYPLKTDWRFIREEFEDSTSPEDGEKEELYTLIANKIIKQNYWDGGLRVWGTQVIELTSKGEMLGINSPIRSTAVRINIHLHQQLYYDLENMPDTDEDWED